MGEKLKIFLRFEFGGEFARRVVDGGHEVSFPPAWREALIAEHHNATFRFCQENVEEV
jgi:hypothetical protein